MEAIVSAGEGVSRTKWNYSDDDPADLPNCCKSLPTCSRVFLQSWPFHKPVNKKQVKDYYEIIKEPMDMELLVKVSEFADSHSNRSAFIFTGNLPT